MDVTLLYFDGCPNWQTTHQRLSRLADELGLAVSCRVYRTPGGLAGAPTEEQLRAALL